MPRRHEDKPRLTRPMLVPTGGLMALGTDGFGRSETRENLRRFFEVDAPSIVVGTLYALAQKGEIEKKVVAQAIKEQGIDPEKRFPSIY